ncbi:MAG: hypothetical protein SGARI_001292 [Bacillariaceae sp.]
MNSRTLLLWLAFAAVPAAAQLKVVKQGMNVDIEDVQAIEQGSDMGLILRVLGQIPYYNTAQWEEVMTDRLQTAMAENGVNNIQADDSDDSDDESGINNVGGIEATVPEGCAKPDPPTPAPAPVCKEDGKGGKKGRGGDDDDDGKGTGKGRGKKGGSSSSSGKGRSSSSSSMDDGITQMVLVLAGSTPCAGDFLDVVFIPANAATVVPTGNIVCSGTNPNPPGLGSSLAVCDGVTLDAHGQTIQSTDGLFGSLVFLGPGSTLTNAVVQGFSAGILAIADAGAVSISDTVLDDNGIGVIALLFESELTMTNVDITDSGLFGMVLISIDSSVSMDDVDVTGSALTGIISLLVATTWTANDLNTSSNGFSGIVIFPLFENTVNWEHVVSNENGSNGLLVLDFIPILGDQYTISDSEFSHNGGDGIVALLQNARFALSNVQTNANSDSGINIEAENFFTGNSVETVVVTLEHVEVVANVEDGVLLNGNGGTISVDSVFSCGNDSGDEGDDFDIQTGWRFSSWSDTTCDQIEFDGDNQDYLVCANECPTACNVGTRM